MNTTTRTLLTLVAVLLLTGCSAQALRVDDIRLDARSIRPTNDGEAVVAKGIMRPDAFLVIRIRGCVDGHGEVDYKLFLSERA